MAHVNCPTCGKQLWLPSIQEQRGVCPACQHEFTVSPPSKPQPPIGDYTGEATGVLSKTTLAVLAALGTALIAILIYRTAAGPISCDPVPSDSVAVKDAAPQPQSPKPTLKTSPFKLYDQGCLEDESGNHEIAIQQYKAAIAIKPDYAEAYYSMGAAHGGLGRDSDALAAFKKAIAIKPDYADAYYNMGIAYRKLGRYTDAVAAFKKAIDIDPDFADAYYNMGVDYAKLGRHADALAAYKKTIDVEPDYADAYFAMGVTYGELGQYADAIDALNKAIDIKPTGVMADLARQGIRHFARKMRFPGLDAAQERGQTSDFAEPRLIRFGLPGTSRR